MTTRRAMACAFVFFAAALTMPAAHAQRPTFTSRADVVFVDVTVLKRNNPVANLQATDFLLTDSGMPQRVTSFAIESVPVDVTLFIDSSGSTAGRLSAMKRDVAALVTRLRPDDRYRLITIDDVVRLMTPWSGPNDAPNLSFQPIGGISLVYDAIAAAIVHRATAGRRHLVVAMTDGEDGGSVIPGGLLDDLVAHSDAVLHIVEQTNDDRGSMTYRPRAFFMEGRPNGLKRLGDTARRTGGDTHGVGWSRNSVLDSFTRIFDEFRQSYVLRFAPEGVPKGGWHALTVTVRDRTDVTVRARRGYFAE